MCLVQFIAQQNIIQGLLVNGSIGRVVGFYKPREALTMGIQIALPDSRDREDSDAPNAPGGSQARMPTSTPSRSQSTDQREQMIQRILRLNTVWPAVQFQNGVTQLCVPLSFEVVSAEGSTEVTREQVCSLQGRVVSAGLTSVQGPSHFGLGTEHPQIARSDSRTRSGGPQQDL